MLELKNVSLPANRPGEEAWLLHEISARFPPGHLCAIVGPSGSGKSTLLKLIAGIRVPEEGSVHWHGRDLEEEDLEPQEIGYVPQFAVAYDQLSILESVVTALRLRVGGLDGDERQERARALVRDVGLEEIGDRRVRILSGGQKRRLALALEMVSAPVLLLCDEVTSGLDAKAEDEVVRLLRGLAVPPGIETTERLRTVLSVTHSLRHLQLHDGVVVLYEGHLVFHGPTGLLCHYFDIPSTEELFPALGRRHVEEWHEAWQLHRASYQAAFHDAEQDVARAQDTPIESLPYDFDYSSGMLSAGRVDFQPPRWHAQFATLLARRWRILLRDRGQLALQIALLAGFPGLVVIFAWDGLPQIQNLTSTGNAVQQLLESAAYAVHASKVAGLVSGLVMFQVILLTLTASNNAAREIAGERPIFEKEKFAGVRPSSYVASKAAFLAVLVAAQSTWMAVFVNTICQFPGDLGGQITILVLVNAAMTAVCLGISSVMKSAEQSSLLSVYLVGFQLPLSGAVLALPRVIGWITQPFIAAYWGWSGYLQTMRDTRFYDVVQGVSQTELNPFTVCCWVLCSHVIAGLLLAYLGAKHSRWE